MEFYEDFCNLMRGIGFDEVGIMDAAKIKLLPEVRAMCAANRCGAYGKKWCCPPGCGTLEECEERVRRFEKAVVMLTVTHLEDSFDFEGMQEGSRHHRGLFQKAMETAREGGQEILPLGSGGCGGCEICTYPDAPCRFPEKFTVPMEAYGIMVSDVCRATGLHYCGGNSTVTYVSAILF